MRSLLKLERGAPVGPQVYEAAARQLPEWDEDTPVAILRSPNAKVPVAPKPETNRETGEPEAGQYPQGLNTDDAVERELWDLRHLPEDMKWNYVYQWRAKLQANNAEQSNTRMA